MTTTIKNFPEKIFYKYQKNKIIRNKKKSALFANKLFNILFIPDKFCLKSKFTFKKKYENIKILLSEILFESNFSDKNSKKLSHQFFQEIPNIYDLLLSDANFILHSDPAANSIEEVFLTYPGFFAISLYRMAHQFYKQKVQIIPRLITEYAHSKTGIDIHAAAKIGKSFSIDHGTGIVIGSSVNIGQQVKLYQGVTLGAINVNKKLSDTKRHPTIENNVTIYAGATILGGNTIIGHDSILGGNVWITKSIPPYSIVYNKSKIKIKNNNSFKII